ncbi:hypothetical protein [Actinomadura sp. DC4]|uniref:hypothetical protein n=1 Tax=Actinomadura sp. DC4 TaxID=3055069 RepID=UPI0025B190E0|nr:hypothetical protein [Actinomadura sp. DC4]MDN3356047.1 hypothetical protein [Actinomadura sp. DC4]
MADPMTFARSFRLRLPGGRQLDGAEFPSARVVVLDDPERGFATVATSIDEAVKEYQGAVVEWPGGEGLREQLHDALTQEHYRRAHERIEASPEDHCAAFTDVALAVPAIQELQQAYAELARLRAGEADDPGPEHSMPTPAQWIRRWNDATAERRLEVITGILRELDRATRCVEMDHDNRLAEAELVARRLADAPTRWAYNQACAALWKHRRRADVAEAANARVHAAVRAVVAHVRATTNEPSELLNTQLLLDAVATALLPADGLTSAPPAGPDLTDGDVKFLADLVGGTGDFVWGDLARHHGMDGSDVERLFRKLTGRTDPPPAAAAVREGCVDHMPTPNPECEACTR